MPTPRRRIDRLHLFVAAVLVLCRPATTGWSAGFSFSDPDQIRLPAGRKAVSQVVFFDQAVIPRPTQFFQGPLDRSQAVRATRMRPPFHDDERDVHAPTPGSTGQIISGTHDRSVEISGLRQMILDQMLPKAPELADVIILGSVLSLGDDKGVVPLDALLRLADDIDVLFRIRHSKTHFLSVEDELKADVEAALAQRGILKRLDSTVRLAAGPEKTVEDLVAEFLRAYRRAVRRPEGLAWIFRLNEEFYFPELHALNKFIEAEFLIGSLDRYRRFRDRLLDASRLPEEADFIQAVKEMHARVISAEPIADLAKSAMSRDARHIGIARLRTKLKLGRAA